MSHLDNETRVETGQQAGDSALKARTTPSESNASKAREIVLRTQRQVAAFPGEIALDKLYTSGIRSAFAVILSIVGVGSAVGQSSTDDMWTRANNAAARERVYSEIRQARVDGVIRPWSPTFIEVPLKSRRVGSYEVRRDHAALRDVVRSTPALHSPVVAIRTTDLAALAGE